VHWLTARMGRHILPEFDSSIADMHGGHFIARLWAEEKYATQQQEQKKRIKICKESK